MSASEFSSLNWLLLGIENRPTAIQVQHAVKLRLGVMNYRSVERKLVQHSWRKLLSVANASAEEKVVEPKEEDTSTRYAPRILRKIAYRSMAGLAIVTNGNARSVIILSGREFSKALVIQCGFDIGDLFGFANDERLFVLDQSSMEIHEIRLSSDYIRRAEEANFVISREYAVQEVELTDLHPRLLKFNLPADLAPSRIAVVLGENSLLIDRVLLWNSRPDSLYIAPLPMYKERLGPIRQGSVKEQSSADSVILACHPLDTGLSSSILTSLKLGDIAVADKASFIWVTDTSAPRILEIALPGTSLRSKVIVDDQAVTRTVSINGHMTIDSLIAYVEPKTFIKDVFASLAFARSGSTTPNKLNKAEMESINSTLSWRHLFLATERCSRSIVLMARFRDGLLAKGPRIEIEKYPDNLEVLSTDLQLTQGAGEVILVWHSTNDAFVEIDPQFHELASLFNAALVVPPVIKDAKRRYKNPPPS